jgi:hypothetical protein
MSVERANVAVESLIADHVAASFRQEASPAEAENTADQVRRRITDHFQPATLGTEQDNAPPGFRVVQAILVKAFPAAEMPSFSHKRGEQLVLLHAALEEFRRAAATSNPKPGKALHPGLFLERQQLALKNELTEGFGRFETWLVSISALTLVLLEAIDYLWVLPILALSVGRSWYLDHQCKKRRARIMEIDAVVQPAAQWPHN